MDRVADKGPKGRAAFFEPKVEYWNVPLMRDDKIVSLAIIFNQPSPYNEAGA